MILEFRGTKGMMDFHVDCGYLQEDEAFEHSQVLQNWPAAESPFVARAAKTVKVGDNVELDLSTFVCFAGDLALRLSDSCAVSLDLDLTGLSPAGGKLQARVAETLSGVSPPYCADNPGFLAYALSWFSQNRPFVRLFLMDGVFWVQAVKK